MLLAACISCLIAASDEAPAEGAVYTSRSFELVKREVIPRSVIYPDAAPDDVAVASRHSQTERGLSQLAQLLEPFFLELRSAQSPYPLLRQVLRDYEYVAPKDQSVEHGRMYIMYIAELNWPFPAPLLADLIRLRVTHPLPQPVHDLMTTALLRWGRDHIAAPPDAELHAKVQGWLEDLKDAELAKTAWRQRQVIRELLHTPLDTEEVKALVALVRGNDPVPRLPALRVLATGGWISDEQFYLGLLSDASPDLRRQAYWGLLLMAGSRGLPHLTRYPERRDAIAARLREVRATPSDADISAEVSNFELLIAPPAPAAATAEPTQPAALDPARQAR